MFGLRARDPSLRAAFFDVFHRSVGHTPFHRLQFLIGTQDAESLATTAWLRHALQLLLATADHDAPIGLSASGVKLPPLKLTPSASASAAAASADATPSEKWAALLSEHATFVNGCGADGSTGKLLSTLSELVHDERASQLAYDLWVSLFPQAWAQLSASEQEGMVKLISSPLCQRTRRTASRRHGRTRCRRGSTPSQTAGRCPSCLRVC